MIKLTDDNINTPEYWNDTFTQEIINGKERIEMERFNKVSEFIPDENIEVLDLGCGKGELVKFLSSKHKHIKLTGIDFSSIAVAYGKEKCPTATFCAIDALNLSYYSSLNKKYDYVVSFETIEHVDKPYKFISEIKYCLKKNGWLILSTPYDNRVKAGLEHVYSFDFFDVLDLLREKDWDIIEIYRYGNNLSNMLIFAKLK